jgi:hypothetical protein
LRVRVERAGRATTAARAFRQHAWVYGICACALIAANWFTGGVWWSFWPLAVWSVVLAVHYLLHKSGTVDEAWAAERTADLHSKSYDAHHIDRIAQDFGGKTADRNKK